MPTGAAISYDDWKAPKADGQALLWPDGAALVEQARRTHDRLARCDARVQGRPLSELRAAARAFVGLGDGLAFVTGHQSELYHPGVWAKNLALHHAAESAGGGGRGAARRGRHGRAQAPEPALAGPGAGGGRGG